MYLLRKSLRGASSNAVKRVNNSGSLTTGINAGSVRYFTRPTFAKLNEQKTATVSVEEQQKQQQGQLLEQQKQLQSAGQTQAQISETQQVNSTESNKVESDTQDDIARATAFLKEINDESIKIVESISEISERRASELYKAAQEEICKNPAVKAKAEKVDKELERFFTEFIGDKDKFAVNELSQEQQFGTLPEGQASTTTPVSIDPYSAFTKYPYLKKSGRNEPYTPQELYLRRVHHGKTSAQLGSVVSEDVYYPYKDISFPPDYKEVTIEKLMAAGAHLGQSVSLWRPSTQPYIYGEYRGIHIIDLEQTVTHLKRAAKVVEGIAEKGGIIIFLGTREGQERSVQTAAERCNGYSVSERWIAGTITNSTETAKRWDRKEIDLADNATGRSLTELEKSSLVKPDLVVILNPTENANCIKEAMQARVPTIGIVDTDCEPSLVTYPIPANDDSIRATNLICGILGKAGQTGRERRIARVAEYQKALAGIETRA